MYCNQNALTYLLRPHHYISEEHYRLEIERLFLPAWHLVGITRELPRQGDYFTCELFGRPILVRNMDGQICAFENICCHRHCELTSQPKGYSDSLKCQYHGWEYQKDGRTARIPEARYFRPWDRENSRVHTFRAETCGELIFVSLAEDGPTLAEHLGEYHAVLSEHFTPPWYVPVWRWDLDFQADWKVAVENTLEGYHVRCLHAKTLGEMSPEEVNTHVFGEGWSTQLTKNVHHGFIDLLTGRMIRRLGRKPTPDYVHHMVYPNFIYIGMDMFRLAEAFIPTGPGTARQSVWLYALKGPRWNPLARVVGKALRMGVRNTVRKILAEDVPIFEPQQRSLRASTHRGVVGALEERVHYFQRYVLQTCYGDVRAEERHRAEGQPVEHPQPAHAAPTEAQALAQAPDGHTGR